jgi:hypothetical protein
MKAGDLTGTELSRTLLCDLLRNFRLSPISYRFKAVTLRVGCGRISPIVAAHLVLAAVILKVTLAYFNQLKILAGYEGYNVFITRHSCGRIG